MSKGLCSAVKGLALTESRSCLSGTSLTVSRAATAAPRSGALFVEAAHKKGAGSTKNGRDSISKRRGVKVFGMQKVKAGGIIIRQLGTKVLPRPALAPFQGPFQFHPGENVGLGRDYTIFAKQDGVVFFERGKKERKLISVYSHEHPKVQAKLPKLEPREGPTRRERWLAQHTPRAVQREQARQSRALNNSTPPNA